MPRKKKKTASHVAAIYQKIGVVALVTLIISAGSMIFYVQSILADDATSQLSSDNTLPVASSVSLNSNGDITLTENTTTAIDCTATVTDNNGCEDLGTISAKIYRSAQTSACSADNNDCYAVASCTEDALSCTAGGSDLDATYTCSITMAYYTDSTDASSSQYSAQEWNCEITPNDGTGAGTPVNNSAGEDVEVNTLLSLDISAATIDYGSLALGASTGATNQTQTVTNTGNDDMDVEFSGTNLTCTGIGAVPSGNQKYGLTDVTYASLTNTMTTSAVSRDLALLQETTDGVPVTDAVYHGVQNESTGVSGTCSGTITYGAVTGI